MNGGIVHITGASGSGTTTLGRALAERLGWVHLDTDDFYWLPTDPPYREKRPLELRLALLTERLTSVGSWCSLSGSLDPWGDPLIPLFRLVVYLQVSTAVRVARLQARELERYGEAALGLGGRMEATSRAFIEWAGGYDHGAFGGRSLPRHSAWLARLPCPVLRLDGTEGIERLVREVEARLERGERSFHSVR